MPAAAAAAAAAEQEHTISTTTNRTPSPRQRQQRSAHSAAARETLKCNNSQSPRHFPAPSHEPHLLAPAHPPASCRDTQPPMWAALSGLAPWPSSWGSAATQPAGGVPTQQHHGGGPLAGPSHRGSTTRTKLAASYEALLTGGDTSSVAVAASLTPPSLVLSDAWPCPTWWDEHLLLKARVAAQQAHPRSLHTAPTLPSDETPWALHEFPHIAASPDAFLLIISYRWTRPGSWPSSQACRRWSCWGRTGGA